MFFVVVYVKFYGLVYNGIIYPRTEEERIARQERGVGSKGVEVKSPLEPVGGLICHLCGKNLKDEHSLDSHMHVHSPTKVLVDL